MYITFTLALLPTVIMPHADDQVCFEVKARGKPRWLGSDGRLKKQVEIRCTAQTNTIPLVVGMSRLEIANSFENMVMMVVRSDCVRTYSHFELVLYYRRLDPERC